MCQAYEGEANWIRYCEKRCRKEGLDAYHKDGLKATNPYHEKYDKYNHDAWNLGFKYAVNGALEIDW